MVGNRGRSEGGVWQWGLSSRLGWSLGVRGEIRYRWDGG